MEKIGLAGTVPAPGEDKEVRLGSTFSVDNSGFFRWVKSRDHVT